MFDIRVVYWSKLQPFGVLELIIYVKENEDGVTMKGYWNLEQDTDWIKTIIVSYNMLGQVVRQIEEVVSAEACVSHSLYCDTWQCTSNQIENIMRLMITKNRLVSLRALVDSALLFVGGKYKQVLELRYLRNCGLNTLMKTFDVSLSTLHRITIKAFVKVKKYLAFFGYDKEWFVDNYSEMKKIFASDADYVDSEKG